MATRARDRIFAWVGVIVIIVSVGALSTAVIIQDIMSRNMPSPDASQAATLDCVDNGAEPTRTAPAAYISAQPVTDLQITDVTQGGGAAAKVGDCLVVKYYGTLASSGKMFDENYSKTSAFAFTLGHGEVITGWDKGLIGMKAGGERRLVIPAAEAYGSQGQGSIPADADLVFYVTLLRIK